MTEQMNRRDFLKLAGKLGAAAVGAQIFNETPALAQKPRETEPIVTQDVELRASLGESPRLVPVAENLTGFEEISFVTDRLPRNHTLLWHFMDDQGKTLLAVYIWPDQVDVYQLSSQTQRMSLMQTSRSSSAVEGECSILTRNEQASDAKQLQVRVAGDSFPVIITTINKEVFEKVTEIRAGLTSPTSSRETLSLSEITVKQK